MENNKIWGWELIVNCSACSKDKITDSDNLRNFLSSLVQKIDMEPYGSPFIEHFATHDPDKAGFSICQMITTSAITGHFVDKNGDCYINIFSCKPFKKHDAVSVIVDYFAPQKYNIRMIHRKSP